MKYKYKKIIILFIILVLIACTKKEINTGSTEFNKSENNNTTTLSNENSLKNIFNNCIKTDYTEEEINCIAQTSGNLSFCEIFKDKDDRDWCYDGYTILNLIPKNKEIDCNNLKNLEGRNLCKGITTKICKEGEYNNICNSIINQNISFCKEDENCKNIYLTYKASKTNNSNLCENITEDKERCIVLSKKTDSTCITRNRVSICNEKVKKEKEKLLSIKEWEIIKEKNISKCNIITDLKKQKTCIAVSTKNKTLCKNLTNYLKYYCEVEISENY